MFTDILGKTRMKLGLHLHTTLSDGKLEPEEAARLYRAAGYDAVAFTDHWVVGEEYECAGLRILSGCEYNTGGYDTAGGVYHIVALGMQGDPGLARTATTQQIVDGVHAQGGIAVLAHPAWSVNSPEMIEAVTGWDATEIFNTVSRDRAYSGSIIDQIANRGTALPLFAADDCHTYTFEAAVGAVMVDVSDGRTDTPALLEKLAAGQCYATQGPEVHLAREEDGRITVRCTPAVKVAFFSQISTHSQRYQFGENMTYAEYTPRDCERWIRAEVTDADGKIAWSNILVI